MRIHVLPAALLILALACSKTADAPPDLAKGPNLPDGKNAPALITALDSVTMAGMEQKTGVWQDADASSEWRARLSSGKVRVIDERLLVGEGSSRRITHYFTDEGKLAAAIEFRIQTVQGTDRPASQQFVLLKLEFTGDSATLTEKTVDGESVPVLPFEIENARKHSMDLLAAAGSAPATVPAKP
ncbi:MAG: hypothetical protein H7Z40_09995 [Phycisphaerae bacterium]|nr:hypothetical protein [Gemmatimonadaceae bacterium]